MPQTREHLDILKLLGLRRGVIALTKCDLVDETTREVVELEVRELVAGSFLADAPLIATSAASGLGVPELKAALQAACDEVAAAGDPASALPFRLAIDRAFVLQGHGTVVTGTVLSGGLGAGDELEWLPAGRRVRARALHSHSEPVTEVRRGMRAAVNLAGVDVAEVRRGQELAAPGYLVASRTLTAQVTVPAGIPRPLKHRLPVRVHLGTAEVLGGLALLEGDVLAPGETALAQLFLDQPVSAVWGQPFVLRESSAATTLGGGRVLQPAARKIRRRDGDALERLRSLADGPPADRVGAVAWAKGVAGFTEADLVREAGVAPPAAPALVAELQAEGRLVDVPAGPRRLLLHANAIREIESRLLDVLARLHAAQPLVSAHERSRVQACLDYLGDDALVSAVVDRLAAAQRLTADGRRIARADFKPKLSINQRKLKDRIVAAHAAAPFQPPEPASFAGAAGGNAAGLADIFEVAVAEGLLVRVSDDIFLHADADAEFRRRVLNRLAAGGPGLTVAEIRDLLGTTRKYAVPLCEYLDRVGVTRRRGDYRVAAQEPTAAGE
jgi:selenocysteine-specific elongation factor